MGRLTHDQYFLQMLQLVSARTTCPRREVGAIIVDADNHVLSTGYNGVPSGFPHCERGRLTHHECDRCGYGDIVQSTSSDVKEGQEHSGLNNEGTWCGGTFKAKYTEVKHSCPGAYDPHGDTRRCMAVHAEVNALLQCSRMDRAHTMYVTCTPCFECAKAICNTPIKRIVATEEYTGAGLDILRTKGIVVTVIDGVHILVAFGLKL